MNKKVWIVIISLAAIALLGAAAYQAMLLVGKGQPVQDNPSAPEIAAASPSAVPTLTPTVQIQEVTNKPEATDTPEPAGGATPTADEATGLTTTAPQPTRAPIIEPARGDIPPIILSTQQPAREPDMAYVSVVEVKDQIITVSGFTGKGQADQSMPNSEVVTTSTTEIYRDETNWDQLTADGMVQRMVSPYSVEQIQPRDILMVWGYKRGDRLVAEVIIDYVCIPGTGC